MMDRINIMVWAILDDRVSTDPPNASLRSSAVNVRAWAKPRTARAAAGNGRFKDHSGHEPATGTPDLGSSPGSMTTTWYIPLRLAIISRMNSVIPSTL